MARNKKSAPAAEIVELKAIAQVEPVLDATDMSPDEMLALIDATLPPEEVQEPQAAIEEPQAPKAAVEDEVDFDQITGAIDAKAVKDTVLAIAHQVNVREDFETDKSDRTGKSNIHRTLKNVRANLVRSHAARVMIGAQVSPTFINRTLHDGSRYNVYALDKFADLVDALTGNKMTNAINIAIVRTMYAFKKAGHAFTKEVALAAASDKLTRTVAPGLRSLLVSHTVSASTAPTQASSTMQALETLGVVKITGGSRKNPTYTICSNPQSKALEQVAEALAA